MKKSLIALAVLAASGAAMAQSSVTIYGRVDASIGTLKTGAVPGAGELSQTGVFNGSNGGLTGSRWGLRGTEDLGGGLTASFKLENRYNVDTGADNGGLFLGESFVALGGGFGTVKLGRTFTAFDDARAIAVSRSLWDSAFTPTGYVYGAGNADYAGRSANAIRYESPSFSGFAGAISYGFGENKTAVSSSTDTLSLHIRYVAGPLAVAYGYQNEEAVGTDVDFNQISASYNFGIAAVSAGWNKRDGSTPALGEDTGYTLGVNVPSGAMNFSLGYATEKTKTNGATSAKGSGFGLGATYSLSKRTTLYAGYKSAKRENGAGVKTAQEKLTSVGVRHDF